MFRAIPGHAKDFAWAMPNLKNGLFAPFLPCKSGDAPFTSPKDWQFFSSFGIARIAA
jgi:hypothetical protein